jgi:hypothetical protein
MTNAARKIYISFIVFFISFNLSSSEEENITAPGQIWELVAKSNKLEHHNSKILFYFSRDAFHTYLGRRGGKVSVVDTRNIQRLNKGNKIKIIKAIHNGNVLEVQLLDGLERNRNFFVITNDLFIDYVEVTTTKKI